MTYPDSPWTPGIPADLLAQGVPPPPAADYVTAEPVFPDGAPGMTPDAWTCQSQSNGWIGNLFVQADQLPPPPVA